VRIDTRTASGFPAQDDAPHSGGFTASGRSLVLLTQDAGGQAAVNATTNTTPSAADAAATDT
jgi:hypothetical protein